MKLPCREAPHPVGGELHNKSIFISRRMKYNEFEPAMSQPQEISGMIAFSAGLLSFVSPCVLPLVPSYITYITGASFKELTDVEARAKLRWAALFHSLFFIIGFSFIFILMGASATYLGQLLAQYQYWIMKGGGILIILLGIHFTGIINIPFLHIEKRFEMRKKPLGYAGSFFVGVVFAAGWTPCIGPILSTILIYASTAKRFTTGILLLTYYSIGLGIPFFLSSLAFNSFLSAFDKIKRYMRIINIVSGLFLVGIGILFLTDTFKEINSYLNTLTNP
ncbi:MAG: cytochrome c biogenesis protein CcdA [Thermodesulfobacteriota bacterium]|jgi:cytochrome c-type biogenesis protein